MEIGKYSITPLLKISAKNMDKSISSASNCLWQLLNQKMSLAPGITMQSDTFLFTRSVKKKKEAGYVDKIRRQVLKNCHLIHMVTQCKNPFLFLAASKAEKYWSQWSKVKRTCINRPATRKQAHRMAPGALCLCLLILHPITWLIWPNSFSTYGTIFDQQAAEKI